MGVKISILPLYHPKWVISSLQCCIFRRKFLTRTTFSERLKFRGGVGQRRATKPLTTTVCNVTPVHRSQRLSRTIHAVPRTEQLSADTCWLSYDRQTQQPELTHSLYTHIINNNLDAVNQTHHCLLVLSVSTVTHGKTVFKPPGLPLNNVSSGHPKIQYIFQLIDSVCTRKL